jgi:methyl-accepting chemotaxis protein
VAEEVRQLAEGSRRAAGSIAAKPGKISLRAERLATALREVRQRGCASVTGALS